LDKGGKINEAISKYTKCIQLSPDFLRAYNNRAVAYYKSGQISNAIDDANAYLKEDPHHAEMYYVRGLARVDLGKAEGLTDLKLAADMGHPLAKNLLDRVEESR
jgi:tetratricopeptide (TPR) repeat protein